MKSKIAKIKGVSKTAISKQIKKLKRLGLIEESKNKKYKTYKVIPDIFEIIDDKVNQTSRGIDPRVEWGYFRIHGYQRRYSIKTSSFKKLISSLDKLKEVKGFVKVGQRPNWRFIVFERDGYKWEIRPKSIGAVSYTHLTLPTN